MDPVQKHVGELEAMALQFREHLADRTLPRELRSGIRALLTEVFRVVESAPAPGDKGRLEWVRDSRPLEARGQEIVAAIERFRKPPTPFYEKGRLGMIRVMEPVRVHFVVGRLGVAEKDDRFGMLGRLVRRVDWLWDRLRAARPDLFEPEAEDKAAKTYRDENELVWGRVTR